MASKNIVVITGSPRPGGNSDILADAFIEGAIESGNTVLRFNAGRMDIRPCKACGYCLEHEGKCVCKDDMDSVYEALYKADMVVFASPIYWYGFTAQIKAAIDRFFVCAARPFPVKATALLAAYEDSDTTVAEPVITHFKAFTGYLHWENKGILAEGRVNAKGDINGRKVLTDARNLGLNC